MKRGGKKTFPIWTKSATSLRPPPPSPGVISCGPKTVLSAAGKREGGKKRVNRGRIETGAGDPRWSPHRNAQEQPHLQCSLFLSEAGKRVLFSLNRRRNGWGWGGTKPDSPAPPGPAPFPGAATRPAASSLSSALAKPAGQTNSRQPRARPGGRPRRPRGEIENAPVRVRAASRTGAFRCAESQGDSGASRAHKTLLIEKRLARAERASSSCHQPGPAAKGIYD